MLSLRDVLLEHYLRTVFPHDVTDANLWAFVSTIPSRIAFERVSVSIGQRIEVTKSAAGDDFRLIRVWGYGWNTRAVIHKVGQRWGLT